MTSFIAPDAERLDRAVVDAQIPEAEHSFIAGGWLDGDGEPFEVRTPITGDCLAWLRPASPSQVTRAAASAKEAQPAWAAMKARDRARILEHAAELMVAGLDRLATLVALDNGKTFSGARGDVLGCAEFLRSAAGWATRLFGATLPEGGDVEALTWIEPVGVVGVVMPFNAPLIFCGMKIAPALATGNTVVAKAPEQAPLAVVEFVRCLEQAGVPPGVVNLVHGGAPVGSQIIDAPPVTMVTFTGSSTVGALVGAQATRQLKKVLLELGGKSANIVYEDAPFDAAVAGSATAIFRNAGQRCFSGSRLLVQESIAEAFIAKLVETAEGIAVGDPFHPQTQVACLVSRDDVERVQAIVDDAVSAGAHLLCGGTAAAVQGAFYRPTILEIPRGVNCSALTEEIFGPVLVVQRFTDADDAIAMANDSKYGLAGGCWTSNLATAMRTARKVNTGFFWINGYGASGGTEATIGGRGASGIGTEKGLEGIREYTVVKTVVLPAGLESVVTEI
ncbi:aldehyde dehydrogenase family protein [Dietzia aurantiaca]|uniref:aldehyde dehydrogenase family protein n=1 Tax=Dietzia aurantiaca TaxID=983873 RepID=UPI001E3F4253|nr:aldehyde dehydrogenase family protein [Dietzia aurantiaca]MCD2261568.1 aldehyde dehydrogenase family protein [Dietzia aurantiaca]